MLADKLSVYFGTGVQRRGRSHFDAGRVQITSMQPDGGIDAQVTGNPLHDVRIEMNRSSGALTIGVDCSCPAIIEGKGFCEHIWATLLAVEARGSYGEIPRSVRVDYLGDYDDPMLLQRFADDDDDDDDDWLGHPLSFLLGGGSQRMLRRPTNSKPKKKDTTPAWSKLLDELATHSTPWPTVARSEVAAIEPLYVLEPEAEHDPWRFVLSLAQQTPTATGRLGKPRRLSIRPNDIPHLANRIDRHIGLMLLGAGQDDQRYGGYWDEYAPARSKWLIPTRALNTLLPMLFETGRFHARLAEGDLTPLTWDGEPWQFVLSVEPEAQGKHWAMVARVCRGAEALALGQGQRFLQGEPALMVREGVMSPVQTHDCFHWVRAFRRQGPLLIESAHRERLLEQVGGMKSCPPIRWPAGWGITEVADLLPRPEISLTFPRQPGRGQRGNTTARVAFHYADVKVDPGLPGCFLMDVKGRRQITRRPEAEAAYWNRLPQLGFHWQPADGEWRLPDRRLLGAVSTLMEEGWTVLGDQKLFRPAGGVSINVTTGIDWFELDGRMDFQGQSVGLPALLAAARKGERFIRLGDGSMGMLPEEWLAQHRSLLELGRVEEGQVRFARTQVALIDALLAQMPEATCDANLNAARGKLREFSGIQARPAPSGFVGTLRPYQEQGLAWLHFLNDFGWGGCLADDMGLGKTVQILALLLDRKRQGDTGPSLIVMPKSIVFNWRREAAAFAPELRVVDYTGNERAKLHEEIAGSDLVLTTYGTCKRDITFLREQQFNYVILDEAQAIKNAGSLNAKAARLLRARRRVVMTGTPVENRLGDLWSLFEFLNPGMLGSMQAFKGAFDNHSDADRPAGNLELLRLMLRPFILRRTKDQVAPELPLRSEQTIDCTMSAEQAAYYGELRDYYRLSLLGRVQKEGMAKSKVYVLEALLRLRQAACHPGLIDESRRSAESAKMDALLPMLDELLAEGHKALVFSQFTTLLGLLREKLDQRGTVYEYLDGQTNDRQRRVDRFQADPNCPLFLISLKAGGTGLNLTAADYVFILDPWWNPAVEAQAIDRTHRIGQDKKVIAYRLITRETVEAKIVELQRRKKDLAGAIISEANSLIQDLTREDLEILLS